MSATEYTPLLNKKTNGLSVSFAIICIIDVFGVFPIIALPKALIDCAIFIIILVCGLQIYTAILLGRCWLLAEQINPSIHRKDRYPYSALTEVTFGKFLAKSVEFLLDITIFGAGIPNLILASQNVELLGLRLSDNSFSVSYCYWIILIGTLLCPILWMGSPKDMKLLCTISVFAVSLVFLLVFVCLLIDTDNISDSEEDFGLDRPLWQTLLSTYGIIAFQFDIHPSILTIQVDMKNKDQLSKVVIGGFAVSVSMATIVTIIAALKHGTIEPSILESLPSSSSIHFAAGLVALQLCLTSAISNSALYQHMEDCLGISREFNHKRCILRTILTLLAVILAESVPRFDLVMSLIGGTLTGPLVFILPPMMYIKMINLYKNHQKNIQMTTFYKTDQTRRLLKMTQYKPIPKFNKNKKENAEIIFCILIITVSIFMTAITTYYNVMNAINYANFSKPCIYNISASLLYL